MSGNVPANLKYSKDHEWVKVEGDVATVGITDHAQAALGDLVFVELPKTGRVVKVGESFAVVESVKAASEVYSPLSGEVVAVNENLGKTPEAINTSPYESWIAKIKLSNTGELETLMDAAGYSALIA